MAHIDVTKENFEQEVIRCEKPVLLDFWAVWCGPCKMIAPVLEQIADAYADRLVVGKINVDEQMRRLEAEGIEVIAGRVDLLRYQMK